MSEGQPACVRTNVSLCECVRVSVRVCVRPVRCQREQVYVSGSVLSACVCVSACLHVGVRAPSSAYERTRLCVRVCE